MRHIISCAVLSWAASTHAAPPPADDGRDASERVTDGLGMALTTFVTPVAAGLIGFSIGSASENCGDEFCDGGFSSGFGTALLAGVVGFLVSPVIYDGLSDGDGSLLGTYLGMFGGLLLLGATEGEGWPIPFITAGIGYAIGDPLGGGSTTPNVGTWRDRDGNQNYTLGLSGSF